MCNAVIFTTVGICSLLYTPVRVCPFVCLVTQIIPIHPHTVHSIRHSSGTARALQQLPHQVGDVQTGMSANLFDGRGQLKCDGTRAETRFRLSAKRTSPVKSAEGRQFSRLLAAEVYASAVVMLDTPCSEVV